MATARLMNELATARLINDSEEDGVTIYTVETWPYHDPPFTGPDGRDWTDFVITGEGAEFEWRTPADAVRRAAERLRSGEWTLRRALKEPGVAKWLDRKSAEMWDLLMEEVEPGSRTDVVDEKKLLLEFGPSLRNGDPFDVYLENDDEFLRDAAECLKLPRWAHVDTYSAGGPGTGYTAACVVLTEGKELTDLATWLQAREAKQR